jgi:hypothetical protein
VHHWAGLATLAAPLLSVNWTMIPSPSIPVWLVDLMLMLGIHPSQVLLFFNFLFLFIFLLFLIL